MSLWFSIPPAKAVVLAANKQSARCNLLMEPTSGFNCSGASSRRGFFWANRAYNDGRLNPSETSFNGYMKASSNSGGDFRSLVARVPRPWIVRQLRPSHSTYERYRFHVNYMYGGYLVLSSYWEMYILFSSSSIACIKVCPKNPVNFNVDNVRVAKFLGASPGASKTFRGMVLKVDTVVGSIKKIENAKVLVIAGGVDTIATETNLIHKLGNYANTEEAKVEELIKESGAKVIVSGAGVGQMALQFCNRNEIMVLKIASQFELDCFCRTTDAVPLLKLGSTVDPSYLGYVDSILVEETGARVTVTNEQGGVATVLLGAGASIMARRLAFNETRSSDQIVISKYAESFELIPKTLAQNANLNVEGIIETLYADHAAGNVKVGIDLKNEDCKDASTMNIWDLYTTKYQVLQYAADAVCNALRVDQDRESQSMFDRLMAEHHASGESLWQHELPTEKIISTFYESIWTNNLQPKREMEILAVKSHGDKLFGLSPDGTLSSFDIHSSEIFDNINLEVFEEPFKYFNEEVIPSRLVTQIYVDPVKGCRFSPSRSDCDEILCIRAIHGQLISYEPGTNIVLGFHHNLTLKEKCSNPLPDQRISELPILME
ncbi:TCP-1/cpn60 chaperonin family protein [Tanacetum coccineum]